jgi:hypothetical protein
MIVAGITFIGGSLLLKENQGTRIWAEAGRPTSRRINSPASLLHDLLRRRQLCDTGANMAGSGARELVPNRERLMRGQRDLHLRNPLFLLLLWARSSSG